MSAFALDNRTVLFQTTSNPDGEHPQQFPYRVRTDGSGFAAIPTPFALPGGALIPDFSVVGVRAHLLGVLLPGEPVNGPLPPRSADAVGGPHFREIFVVGGKNLLQLTNFRYAGTDWIGLAGRHAFFRTTADPLGTNPAQLVQVFSIDTLGRRLRQLTQLREVGGTLECAGVSALPCHTRIQDGVAQDLRGSSAVFASSCDALDTDMYGQQLFAIDPKGFRLVQLTAAPGCVVDSDGSLTVELTGPFAYSELRR